MAKVSPGRDGNCCRESLLECVWKFSEDAHAASERNSPQVWEDLTADDQSRQPTGQAQRNRAVARPPKYAPGRTPENLEKGCIPPENIYFDVFARISIVRGGGVSENII